MNTLVLLGVALGYSLFWLVFGVDVRSRVIGVMGLAVTAVALLT